MINFNKYLTRKKAFVPFITAGDPSLDKTKEFIKALIEKVKSPEALNRSWFNNY